MDDTFLDEALYYMDQITAEKMSQQLVDISVACSPYYKENERREMTAKLQYKIAKLRNQNDDDADDVDEPTRKRNIAKLKSFFGKKREEYKAKATQ